MAGDTREAVQAETTVADVATPTAAEPEDKLGPARRRRRRSSAAADVASSTDD